MGAEIGVTRQDGSGNSHLQLEPDAVFVPSC